MFYFQATLEALGVLLTTLGGGSQTSLLGGVPDIFADILKRSDSGDSKCEHLFEITKGAIGVMRSWGRMIRKDRYAKEAA